MKAILILDLWKQKYKILKNHKRKGITGKNLENIKQKELIENSDIKKVNQN